MGYTDESYFRIIYETKGQAALEELQKDLDNTVELVKELKAGFQAGAISEEDFDKQARQLAKSSTDSMKVLKGLKSVIEEDAAAIKEAAAAREDLNASALGMTGSANAWGKAVAEGSEKAKGAAVADKALAAAHRDLTGSFGSGSSLANAWSRAITEVSDKEAQGRFAANNYAYANKDLSHSYMAAAGSASAWGAAIKEGTALATANAAAVSKIGVGAKSARMGLVELSRGFEDVMVTGSPMGAINNLNQALTDMALKWGLSASALGGLSAGITVFGIAVTYLVNHWSELTGKTAQFTSRVEELTAKLEELEKKPHKLAIDLLQVEAARYELDKLKKELSDFDSIRAARGTTTQKASAAVKEAIAEHAGEGDEVTGGENLQKALRAILGKRGELDRLDPAGSARVRSLMTELEANRALIEHPADGMTDETRVALIESQAALKQQYDTAVQARETEVNKGIGRFIGRAGAGNEQARSDIESLLTADRGTAAKFGIGDKFVAALSGASRESIEGNQAIVEAAKATRHADSIRKSVEQKRHERLRTQNAEEERQQQAVKADADSVQAGDNEERLAQKQVDDEAAKKAKDKHDQAVQHQVSRLGKISEHAAAATLRGQAGGMSAAAIEAELSRRIAKAIAGQVPRGMESDVTAGLTKKAMESAAATNADRRLEMPGVNQQGAARMATMEADLKQAHALLAQANQESQHAQWLLQRGLIDQFTAMAYQLRAGTIEAQTARMEMDQRGASMLPTQVGSF